MICLEHKQIVSCPLPTCLGGLSLGCGIKLNLVSGKGLSSLVPALCGPRAGWPSSLSSPGDSLTEVPLFLAHAQALPSLDFFTLSPDCLLPVALPALSPTERLCSLLQEACCEPWTPIPCGHKHLWAPHTPISSTVSLVHHGNHSSAWSVFGRLISIYQKHCIQVTEEEAVIVRGGQRRRAFRRKWGWGWRDMSMTCISSQLPSFCRAAGCPQWVGCVSLRLQPCWGEMSFLSRPSSLALSLSHCHLLRALHPFLVLAQGHHFQGGLPGWEKLCILLEGLSATLHSNSNALTTPTQSQSFPC